MLCIANIYKVYIYNIYVAYILAYLFTREGGRERERERERETHRHRQRAHVCIY